MGLTVEHAIVIGIFVVIVAILGIAISGAMGSDGSLFGTPQTAVATSDDGGGSRPVVLRDSDISKLAEAARRQKEMAQRRDQAVREMTTTPGPGPVAEAPRELELPSATPPSGRPSGTALKRSAGDAAPAVKEPEAAPAKAAGEGKPAYFDYPVVDGDSLWKIVRAHYGDGDVGRIVDYILSLNPEVDGDNIRAGETILRLPTELPDDLSSPPVLKKSTSKATSKTTGDVPSNSTAKTPKYEVREGDSLQRIAERELGDSSRWEEIYELNRKYVPAPEKLYPGQTLLMPAR